MKIFVTGGAGFVGRHLVNSLVEKNHKVIIFDNLSNSTKAQVSSLRRKGAIFQRGDVRDFKVLEKSTKNIDFVIHLAAKINVEESIVKPELTHDTNVTGTLNVLRACIANKIPNVIAASSAAVYGNSKNMPLRESAQTFPISPYGASKLAIEHYLQAFSNCYPLNAVSLRFFNIYGKGQSPEYAGVIDKFMSRIVSNRPLVIYGDGKNTRDFVSIDDIVYSILVTMKKMKGKRGNVYNIATGRSVSINDLAKLMISLSGKKLDIIHEKPKKGDIRDSKASIKLAKKELGFVPKVPLKEGLKPLYPSLS